MEQPRPEVDVLVIQAERLEGALHVLFRVEKVIVRRAVARRGNLLDSRLFLGLLALLVSYRPLARAGFLIAGAGLCNHFKVK